MPTGKILPVGFVNGATGSAEMLHAPVGYIKQILARVLSGNGTDPTVGLDALKSFTKLPGAKPTVFNANFMGKSTAGPSVGWRADVALPSSANDSVHFGNKHTVAEAYTSFNVPYRFSRTREFGNDFGFVQRSKLPAGTEWRQHRGDSSTLDAMSHPPASSSVPFGSQNLETVADPARVVVEKLFMVPSKDRHYRLSNARILDVTNTPRKALAHAVDSYRERLPGHSASLDPYWTKT